MPIIKLDLVIPVSIGVVKLSSFVYILNGPVSNPALVNFNSTDSPPSSVVKTEEESSSVIYDKLSSSVKYDELLLAYPARTQS